MEIRPAILTRPFTAFLRSTYSARDFIREMTETPYRNREFVPYLVFDEIAKGKNYGFNRIDTKTLNEGLASAKLLTDKIKEYVNLLDLIKASEYDKNLKRNEKLYKSLMEQIENSLKEPINTIINSYNKGLAQSSIPLIELQAQTRSSTNKSGLGLGIRKILFNETRKTPTNQIPKALAYIEEMKRLSGSVIKDEDNVKGIISTAVINSDNKSLDVITNGGVPLPQIGRAHV